MRLYWVFLLGAIWSCYGRFGLLCGTKIRDLTKVALESLLDLTGATMLISYMELELCE